MVESHRDPAPEILPWGAPPARRRRLPTTRIRRSGGLAWVLFVAVASAPGCGARKEATGQGTCVSEDPCGGRARAAGERCGEAYDPCSGVLTTCPCGEGLVCDDSVCVAKPDGVVQPPPDELDPRGDEPGTCDPVNVCPRPGPEGAPCGVQSAGCPGVDVTCRCVAGLACVDGTCQRAAAGQAGGPCRADADHCCMPDGSLVRPGGCQPMYPSNVQPATRRNPDGTCQQIPCFLRCLPESATIDTPGGAVAVTALHPGDLVYTRDETGARIVTPVLRVGAVPVSAAHAMAELTLADGRVARASPRHPVAHAGPTLGDVRLGDRVDGSEVVGARTVPYDGSHTWDLLPAGPTGEYWADGVPLGSTLTASVGER